MVDFSASGLDQLLNRFARDDKYEGRRCWAEFR